jgi:hypothetical protein
LYFFSPLLFVIKIILGGALLYVGGVGSTGGDTGGGKGYGEGEGLPGDGDLGGGEG